MNIMYIGSQRSAKLLLQVRVLLAGLLLLLSPVRTSSQAAPLPPQTPVPGSVFGVEMTPVEAGGGLEKIASPNTQTSWTRGIEVIWSEVEPAEGLYDWTAPSFTTALQELDNASGSGLTPIIVIRSTPGWAQKYASFSCGPVRADKLEAFGKFMHDLLAISPMAAYELKYWEIWNEPDIAREMVAPDYTFGGCWGESDDEYYGGEYFGQMLEAIYPRIKDADPAAQVIVGGLNLDCNPNQPPVGKDCTSGKFLEGILLYMEIAGSSYFDGVAFHAYDYYPGGIGHYSNSNWQSAWNTTGPVSIAKARFIRSVLAKYQVSGKFLMNTENALLLCPSYPQPCPENVNGELTKAKYVPEAYGAAIAEGLQANIWFDATGSWRRGNGLLKNNLDPLPAYEAYQFASQELGGVSFVRSIQNPLGVTGYEFKRPDRHIWLLWSLDGDPHDVTLPQATVKIYDVFGEPQSVGSSLTVTVEPVYIEYQFFPRMHLPLISTN